MVGFIGAGQVGTTLGLYFAERGIQVSGYFSRAYVSAEKSALITHSQAYIHLDQLVNASKFILITTPDDAISDVATTLANSNTQLADKVICHTSGVHSSAILEPLFQKGATIASVHPMLSFADMDYALRILQQTPLTFEGKGNLIKDLRVMLTKAHLDIQEINTEQKALYHAAACMVSNYLVTLMDTGIESLVRAGFDTISATKLITPLVEGTLHNILEKGSARALTGPLARGDFETIRTHLSAISKEDKSIEQVYRILGERTLGIVRRQGNLDEYTLEKLKEVLQDEEDNNRNH